MAQFEKLLQHPERDKLVAKLISGDTPKQISEYLKIKYNKPEDKNNRLSASLLEEFRDKYINQQEFLAKIIEEERQGKLDKKIAESLLNNKAWKDRLAQLADDQIDLKKKILDVLHVLEVRAEQVFDKIQENPGNFKGDYVLLKYFDLLGQLIEKADKVINERPDQTIQHNISIQMVEQHSVAFQEAIRELLTELDPDISARFLDLLTKKMSQLKSSADFGLSMPQKPQSIEKQHKEVDKLLVKAEFVAEELNDN